MLTTSRTRLTMLVLVLAAAAAFAGCDPANKEPDPLPGPQPPATMTLGRTSVSIGAEGGSVDLEISSPVRPEVKSDDNWITIQDGTYKDYKITVVLKVAANTTKDARSATVTVKADGKTSSVTVTQEKPDLSPKQVTLSTGEVSFKAEGASATVVATSPAKPEVSGAPGWLAVKVGNLGEDYTCEISLTASENATGSRRSATLTVSAGNLSAELNVSQGVGAGISQTLCTENPTDKAVALYEYLLSIYGKKTLSSTIADVNWNLDYAEKVHGITGQYPAVNTYDFIHIPYSRPGGWIDYSDLTPVTSWNEAGGITSLMWHFNVPVNGTVDPASDGALAFYSSGNTFKPSRALTANTWENKWFYGQMDEVVKILLALQERDIAALWRPFHEAAGNSTLRQQAAWATAWFWWGTEGPEQYVRLWRAMFDYFKSKGVRNLIWVWTTQNFNGDRTRFEQDTAWYPGDEYVDIVGRDLYGINSQGNVSEFKQIQEAYPNRMVALAECGQSVDGDNVTPMADVPTMWGAGAKWLYFMPWCGTNMATDSWWRSAMSSASVVKRSDIPAGVVR